MTYGALYFFCNWVCLPLSRRSLYIVSHIYLLLLGVLAKWRGTTGPDPGGCSTAPPQHLLTSAKKIHVEGMKKSVKAFSDMHFFYDSPVIGWLIMGNVG